MSGAIQLREDRAWIAAGWVYRRAIALVLDSLPLDSPVRRLLAGGTEPNLEFLSLEGWSGRDLTEFHGAASRAYVREESAGSVGWATPESFQSFMAHFSDLLTLLAEAVATRSDVSETSGN